VLPAAIVILGGFLLGVASRRWWSVAAAVPFGIVVASVSEVEVSPVVLGIGYGVIAAAAICAGVATAAWRRS
jgi:hypothetical protein